ncbi:MAG: ABC transporter permease [Candidatus Bathyarchaeota archaeon]|nr:ABC transporter permease [Candidatus Bathyarchaeota archaeon]
MKAIIHILEHDFRNFFRYKWWLVGLISMNLADLFIMAIVYNRMLNPEVTETIGGYFQFFAPGLTVTGLFASAFMIGREINMERRREVHHYMLSLPMTRFELAMGRVLSGGLRGMLYMSPLLATCLILLPNFPTIEQFLLILAVLFFLATGISGLSIAIAVSTSSLEKFITARGLVYYTLFFCSSVFYPLYLIQSLASSGFPTVLITLAEINPLSNASDMIRSFLLGYPSFSPTMVFNVVVFSVIFTLSAAFAYMKIIERK